jgi:hypothetical protein
VRVMFNIPLAPFQFWFLDYFQSEFDGDDYPYAYEILRPFVNRE